MKKRGRAKKARQCTGKVRYPHYGAACDALGNDELMHPYFCVFCSGFHLGHPRLGDPVLLSPKFIQLDSVTQGADHGLPTTATSPETRDPDPTGPADGDGCDGWTPVHAQQAAPEAADGPAPTEGSPQARPQPDPGTRQGSLMAPPFLTITSVSSVPRLRRPTLRHRYAAPALTSSVGRSQPRKTRAALIEEDLVARALAYFHAEPEYQAILQRQVMARLGLSTEVLRSTQALPLWERRISPELLDSLTVGVRHG